MSSEMLTLASLTSAFFLALLLFAASLHKFAARDQFTQTLARYALLPASMLRPVSILMPVIELSAASLLLLPSMRLFGAVLAAALFLLYACAIGINLLRGRTEFDCGCGWGAAGGEKASTLSGWLIVRNTLLILLASLPALSGGNGSMSWVATGNAAAAGLVFALLWVAADQLLANRPMAERRHT
jgi:hypothetical protein